MVFSVKKLFHALNREAVMLMHGSNASPVYGPDGKEYIAHGDNPLALRGAGSFTINPQSGQLGTLIEDIEDLYQEAMAAGEDVTCVDWGADHDEVQP